MQKCGQEKVHNQVLQARRALAYLAQARSANVQLPSGYAHIESFHGGIYQTWDYVVPWTKSACNLNTSIMLVLQDWSSVNELRRAPIDWHQVATGQSKSFSTNARIRALLRQYFDLSFCQTYGTDIVPYAKPGDRRSFIPKQFMIDCALNFTLNEISIVKPCVVLAIGIQVFNSLYAAFKDGEPPPSNVDFFDIIRGGTCETRVFKLSHPQRPLQSALRDEEWQRAARYHSANCTTASNRHPGVNLSNAHHPIVDPDKPNVFVTIRDPKSGLGELEVADGTDCVLRRLGTCRRHC